ncbi:Hsp70 family protein [Nocardia rosealba]|uniref:Hsp70 family protein n=1 Tax=Nocardia rosealba TaxID=2878563 RepID=UPI001CD963F5|nr:Hsp70 family protein [Nocardia rosealba]MCA2210316.1 Hsp70 family protein [Nocardia rosealba]
MRTSLGISAGNEVVCSALVATAPSGEQNFDYRVVSADAAHSDLGDLVSSSIELMTNQLPVSQQHMELDGEPLGRYSTGAHRRAVATRSRPPTSVAVAYRNREQAQAIRAACSHHRDLRLVPEGTAALAYLRNTGLLDRYSTVAVIDLGATGLTVTVADQSDGTVLHTERTPTLSGNAIDELIYHHLVDLHYARRGTRPNRQTLTNRGRAAKEHLTVAPAVTIDHVAGQPLKLTRSDFEELIGGLLRNIAVFSGSVFTRAPKYPEAVAVIGGCANIPSVVDTLDARLDVPVVTVPDPEAVIAKGAALLADAAAPSALQVATLGDAPSGTFAKVIGTLAGAVVVVGLVIGYGVRTISPDAPDVTPAGTSSTVRQPPLPVVPPAPTPTYRESTDRTGVTVAPPVVESPAPTQEPTTTTPPTSTPSTTPAPSPSPTTTAPTLRPDPNLPQIPYPESPGGINSGSGRGQQRPSTPNTSPTQAPASGSLVVPPTTGVTPLVPVD